MAGINKVILVGNLGRDPEVRYTQSGMAICNLNVAVTERKKDGDEWKDHTEWFRVVTFGKTAENAGNYLAKGRQVYVEGKLKSSKYKDKDGTEKTSVEVTADVLQYLGANEAKGNAPRDKAPTREPSQAAGKSSGPPDEIDDDLPF